MSDTRSDEEKNFFVAAAETYLDVDSAMTEFQRQVQDECKEAIRDRLGEISQACGKDCRLEYFREYRESGTSCIYLGRQMHHLPRIRPNLVRCIHQPVSAEQEARQRPVGPDKQHVARPPVHKRK
jgi:hypothetical protein